MIDLIRHNLEEAREILDLFSSGEKNLLAIENAARIIVQAIKNGNKVICCGNGGSMCDSMHFAEELTGRFRCSRYSLPAIAISDPAHITCTANDYGFEYIFSRPLEALGKEGDVLLAFTSGGNSLNIVKAAQTAKEKDMMIIGLTGKTGGKLAELCDVEIRAPESKYADRVQELHTKIIHILLTVIEHSLGLGSGYG